MFMLVMSHLAKSLDLGSMPAERVEQGEVCNLQCWAEISWLLLDLAIESSWLALGGPFLCMKGLRNHFLAM